MSKTASKKVVDETQNDNYVAGFNYGRLARAGINAFRELVIAWRTGNLEANRLIARKKRESAAISESVLKIPAFLRKSGMTFPEWEKQNPPANSRSFKPRNFYAMDKTIEILVGNGVLNTVTKVQKKIVCPLKNKPRHF